MAFPFGKRWLGNRQMRRAASKEPALTKRRKVRFFRPFLEILEERIMLDASLPPDLVVGRTQSSYTTGGIQNHQETITYTVYNEQADPLNGVLLTDTLAPGVSIVSASQQPDQNGQKLAWSLGSIGGFDRASVTLTVSLPSTIPLQLDTGAQAYAMLDGASVQNSTPSASLRQGNVDPSLLASTPDANTTDPFVQEEAAALDYDPEKIVAFLHDDIGYNSYLGSVRGARGTLWSSSGNALDVASLGVALMRASGIPAQYVSGTLSQSQAQQLILSMFPSSFQTTGYIPAGTQTADPANDPQLLAETEQHYWFQFDTGSGMTDADPLMTGTIGQPVTASTGTFAEVPDNLREKTEIQVVAETESEFNEVLGEGLQTQVVLDQTFNDVDLVGHPLSFSNAVSTSSSGLGITQFVYTYTPYLALGDEANPDSSNDQIIDGTPYQEVYSNEPLVSVALTGLFLNVTLSGPQGPAETFQHTIFDRIGFAARQNPNSLDLSFDTNTPPAVTDYDVTTVNVLAGLQDANVYNPQANQLSELVEQLNQLNPSGTITDTAVAGPVLNSLDISTTRLMGEQLMQESDGLTAHLATLSEVVAYFSRPRVIITSESLDPQSGTFMTKVDLSNDMVRALAFPGQTASAPFNFNFVRGFSEDTVESQVAADGNPNGTSISAGQVLIAANQQGIPLALLQGSGSVAQLDSFGLDADATARITAALEAGQVVLVPTAPVSLDNQATIAWFEIDPTTGYTIGVGTDGSHFGIAPLVTLTLILLVAAFTVPPSVGALQATASGVPLLLNARKISQDPNNTQLIADFKQEKDQLGARIDSLTTQAQHANIFMRNYYLTYRNLLNNFVQLAKGISSQDPPLTPSLSDEFAPHAIPLNVATGSIAQVGTLAAGNTSVSADLANVAATGQLSAEWSGASTSAFQVASLNAASALVTDAAGKSVGSGTIGLSLTTPVPVSISGNSTYSINGTGSLSFYGPAESNLGVSGNWSSYSAKVSGNSVDITLTTDSLTLNGKVLPAGTYTITTTSATLVGSGLSTSPNFAGSASLNLTGGTVTLGAEQGTINLGGKPLDLSSGATLDGYAGSLTVAAGGGNNTDNVTLNGKATNVLTVSATPNTVTTDQNTPKTFQINVNTSFADTYNLTAQAPPGWTVSIDNTGKVTVTPAPGLQSGTLPIQIIAQSQTNANLVAQTTVNVTVQPTTAGETLSVITDPLLTVPLTTGADLPTAFQVQIHNNGPAPVTENLAFSNLPSGFTLLDSGTSVTIPAGQTGILGVYLVPTSAQLPAVGTPASFTVTATNANNAADVQTFNESFTVPAVDNVTINSDPQVSSTPGTATTATLTLSNTGNASETVGLSSSTPTGLSVTGLKSVTLAAGQTTTETISLTPSATVAVNTTLAATITATYGPTSNPQTATTETDLQVVSPQVIALSQAVAAANQDSNNGQLAQTLTQLQTDVTALQTTPTDGAALSAVQFDLGNVSTLLSSDPALTSFVPQLQPLQTDANSGNVTTLLNGLPTFFGNLTNTLEIEATQQFTISVSPTQVDLATGQSQVFPVLLTNAGPDPVTLTLSASGVPSGITSQFDHNQVTLGVGASQTVNLTLTQTQDLTQVFTLTVTAAASLVQESATAAVAVRPATADVIGVTVNPNAIAQAGTPLAVSAQVFNTANVDRNILVQPEVLDSTGAVIDTPPATSFTLVPGSNTSTVNLGQVDTTGLADGIYSLRVVLESAAGTPLPGNAGQTPFLVGTPITATVSASATLLPPGSSTVATTIAVNNTSQNTLSEPVGDIVVGYDAPTPNPFNIPNQDGATFIFENTSDAPITNAVFRIGPGGPNSDSPNVTPDSFNVGTIPANSFVVVTPGVSDDGQSGHTFFQHTGGILDDSDSGPSGDDVEFELTGIENGLVVDSGVFTPRATQGPTIDGTVPNMNFLGGPGNNDGPEGVGFFKTVAILTAAVPGVPVQVDEQLPPSGYTIDSTTISPAASSVSSSDVIWQSTLAPGNTTQQFKLSGQTANLAPGEVQTISTGTTVLASFSAADSSGPADLTDFAVDSKNTLGTLDLRTGVFTPIAPVSNLHNGFFGDIFRQPGGTLYGYDASSNLVTIDMTTGQTKLVGNSGHGILGGAFSPGGTLFAASPTFASSPNDLYTVDPTTGAATLVGNMGSFAPGGFGSAYDLKFSSDGTLFLAEANGSTNSTLYTVNTSTGKATEVGQTGFELVAIDFEEGKLYGFTAQNQIVTLNTTTGAGTLLTSGIDSSLIFAVATAATSSTQTVTFSLHLPPLTVAAEHIISLTPPSQTVDRNATASYSVVLTNPLSTDETYNLSLAGLTGFTTNLAASVPVPAGQTVDVPLQVMVPASASSGPQVFEVNVTTSAGASDSVEGQLTVSPEVAVRSLGVHVDLTPTKATVGQGDSTHYTLTLTNVGDVTDTYNLGVAGLPQGVTASFSSSSITVTPGLSSDRTVVLTLTTASGTTPGSYPFQVTATSATDASVTASAQATLGVESQGVTLQLTPTTTTPGKTFQLTVTNAGSAQDTFNLSLSGPAAQVAKLATTQVTLKAGASQVVQITTGAANFAVQGPLNLIAVATSQANPAVTSQAKAALLVPATTGLTDGFTPAAQTLSTPSTTSYLLQVNNTGNALDSYEATITGTSGPIQASLIGLDGQPTQTVPLFQLPGLTSGALLVQTTATNVGEGTVTITVHSLTNDNAAPATATLTVPSPSPAPAPALSPSPSPAAAPASPQQPQLVGLSSAFDSQGLLATVALYANGDLYLLLPGFAVHIDSGIQAAELYTDANGNIGLVVVLKGSGATFALDSTGIYFLGQGLLNLSVGFNAAGPGALLYTSPSLENLVWTSQGAALFNFGSVMHVFADPNGQLGVILIVLPNGMLIEADSQGAGMLPSGVEDASTAFSSEGGAVLELVLDGGEGLMVTPFGLLDVTQILAAITGALPSTPTDVLFSNFLAFLGNQAVNVDAPIGPVFTEMENVLGQAI